MPDSPSPSSTQVWPPPLKSWAGRGGRVERTLANSSRPSAGTSSSAPSPSQLTRAQIDLVGFERLARPDHHARPLGVDVHDVERLARGDADAAALADREAQNAVMAAEHAAVDVDDVARRGGIRLQLGDDVGVFALRHEADVLAVGLGGDGQAHALGDGADLGLGHAAQRKAQIVDLLLRGGKQEIALVAVGVDRAEQRAMRAVGAAADIVAGRQRVGAEIARGLQKVGELDGLVARNARDRRLAGDIAFSERVDHRLAEPLLIVEHIVRDAERLGHAARVGDILAGAARAGAMRGRAMVVELQRHADDVVAFLLQEAGDDRGIHAAGHRDDDARVGWPSRQIEAVHDLVVHRLVVALHANEANIGQGSAAPPPDASAPPRRCSRTREKCSLPA